MSDLLPAAIGLGLIVSLLFAELLGLAAGGLVVPGYLALQLQHPFRIACTIGVGLATHGLMRGLSNHLILYGRRRMVLTILLGYLLGALWQQLGPLGLVPGGSQEYLLIGYIIPGLVALWIERQGLWETLTVLLITSSVVRLLLILCLEAEFLT